MLSTPSYHNTSILKASPCFHGRACWITRWRLKRPFLSKSKTDKPSHTHSNRTGVLRCESRYSFTAFTMNTFEETSESVTPIYMITQIPRIPFTAPDLSVGLTGSSSRLVCARALKRDKHGSFTVLWKHMEACTLSWQNTARQCSTLYKSLQNIHHKSIRTAESALNRVVRHTYSLLRTHKHIHTCLYFLSATQLPKNLL